MTYRHPVRTNTPALALAMLFALAGTLGAQTAETQPEVIFHVQMLQAERAAGDKLAAERKPKHGRLLRQRDVGLIPAAVRYGTSIPPNLAFSEDLTVVRFDDPPANGKAKARAALFTGTNLTACLWRHTCKKCWGRYWPAPWP